MKIQVTLVRERETKGSFLYVRPPGGPDTILNLYIRKNAIGMGANPPAQITVTVEAA